MANAHLRIIYRSNSHAPFWVVAGKSGVWEKKDFVHLAQAANNWTENKLVVPSKIGAVQDLRGGKPSSPIS
jgi:hypothetical protein